MAEGTPPVNRTEYNKAYNKYKQPYHEALREAIKKLQEENPQHFAELQARAKHELEHPPERPIIRHPLHGTLHFNAAEFIRQHHTQSYYIRTKDAFGDKHLYFESLNGETPEDVLARRHPKFTERNEKVIEVERCVCPLCQNLN